MTNSRQKGAAGEREVAIELFRELGMKFKRNLRQYQEAEHGDLDCDNEAFPFTIEVKRHKAGWNCAPKWEAQAKAAALTTGKFPAVIYRFNGQKWRVRVWIDAIAEAVGGSVVSDTHCDTDIRGFAFLAREIMARRACSR